MNDLNDIHANCEQELAALRSRVLERVQNTNDMVELAIADLIKGVLSHGATLSVLRNVQSNMIALGAKPAVRKRVALFCDDQTKQIILRPVEEEGER